MTPGTKLGRYEIRAKIGEGGMGEVYLAQDTKLDRKVALKILPAELAANRERMRRFVQEAKSAAALNHPNIAHVYEIGEHDGTHFIAMEFVDGQTLRKHISLEPSDLKKTLRHLQQVAEGLAKAHAAGIVHRDLKPENIMISVDGYAKILDFGLSKLIGPTPAFNSRDASSSQYDTAIWQHSVPGMVMGTVGYMSPEQAQGRVREIDQRSDIFSFGCILFEAAAGRRAFEGKDAIDSLHKIVHGPTPQLEETDSRIPEDLYKVVRRCLAKDPERRFQNIKDVAIELEEIQLGLLLPVPDMPAEAISGHLSAPPASRAEGPKTESRITAFSQKRIKLGTIAVVALVIILLVGAGVGLFQVFRSWRSFKRDSAVTRPAAAMNMKLLTATGTVGRLAVSPDGKFLAYAQNEGSDQSLWTKQIATNSNVQLAPPTARFYSHLAFSPDGNYVYYVARSPDEEAGSVYRIPTLGGTSVKVLSRVYDAISFSHDGRQVAFLRYNTRNSESSLLIANADGTNEQLLATRSDHEWFAARGGAWSPDGMNIAIGTGDDREAPQMTMAIIDIKTRAARALTHNRWNGIGSAAWTSDGKAIIFSANERDTSTARHIWEISYPSGEARRITSDLNSYSDISLTSDSSALVATQTETISNISVSSASDLKQAKQITTGRDDGAGGVAWTPDGRVVFISSSGGNSEIWIMKSDGSGQQQLTSDGRTKIGLAVSPDGNYIVYAVDFEGTHLWRSDIDGSHPLQLTNGNFDTKPRISPDSQTVIYSSYTSGALAIWKIPMAGGTATQLTKLRSSDPDISPDGKLIACFHNDEQARAHLLIVPVTGGDPIKTFDVPQSVSFGIGPRWTPDGQAISYVDRRGRLTSLWAYPYDGTPPRHLADFEGAGIRWHEWSRDGRQLVMVRSAPRSDAVMISNFR